MNYTKIEKPQNGGFLQKEDDGFLLLEHGGRIILGRPWTKIAKTIASYTKLAKTSGSYTKVAKPALS